MAKAPFIPTLKACAGDNPRHHLPAITARPTCPARRKGGRRAALPSLIQGRHLPACAG